MKDIEYIYYRCISNYSSGYCAETIYRLNIYSSTLCYLATNHFPEVIWVLCEESSISEVAKVSVRGITRKTEQIPEWSLMTEEEWVDKVLIGLRMMEELAG